MSESRCINCMKTIDAGIACPHCGALQQADPNFPYALRPNTILHGKYLIGRVLGQGGFGITYVGFDLALEMKVAVKEYFPQGLAGRSGSSSQLVWNKTQLEAGQAEQGVKAFLKEARQMAKLDSLPAIVRVRDTFPDNGTAYIVMDFVEGETMKVRLLKTGPMKFEHCIAFLEPLMQSLDSMHANELIHRDISPDNIMVQPDGTPCLLDLGAAKDLSGNSSLSTQMVMKKGFSPLEQYTTGGNIGPWTDVYAMSATIYYAVTGRLVPNVMDRAFGQCALNFALSDGTLLPPPVQEVLQEGLAIQPADRIQSIGELEKWLRQAAEDSGRQAETFIDRSDVDDTSDLAETNEPTDAIESSDIGSTEDTADAPNTSTASGTKNTNATSDKIDAVNTTDAKPTGAVPDSTEAANMADAKPTGVVLDSADATDTADAKHTGTASDTTEAENTPDAKHIGAVSDSTDAASATNTEHTSTTSDTLHEADTTNTRNRTDPAAKEGSSGKSTEFTEPQKTKSGKSRKKAGLIAIAAAAVAVVIGIAAIVGGKYSSGEMADITTYHEDGYARYVKGSSYRVEDIYTITFMDSIEENSTAWDVSGAGDGSVMAWVETNGSGYDLYIGGDGGVDLADGNYLFAFFSNVEEINFNSCVYTDNVTDMSRMFCGCSSLVNLDLSSFDTSKVTNMGYMFFGCNSLTSLDLSGFDTSNASGKYSMFLDCSISAEEAGLN